MDVKTFSVNELAKHKSKNDLWISVHGKVYDISKYTEEHPGGIESFLEVAGTDATSSFEDVGHSADARETMEEYYIGELEGGSEESNESVRGSPRITKKTRPFEEKEEIHTWRFILLLGILMTGTVIAVSVGLSAARKLGSGTHNLQFGGFWSGSLAASTVVAFVGTYLFFRVEKALTTYPSFVSYPAHRKLENAVAKVTTIKGVLNPQEYQRFPLIRKQTLGHNVMHFVFGLPSTNSVLGLPIGQHIAIRAEVGDKTISRSYTPVSNNSDRGELRLAIKIYPDGALTGGYLGNLKIGDQVEIRGPKGAMRYRKGRFTDLGMVAGGTGITPMYQLIRAICEDDTDSTRISLVFANSTENDIILRQQLEQFQTKCPDKFKIWYMVNQAPTPQWPYGTGRITKDTLKERMPIVSPQTQILLCGPPRLVNACKAHLETLGFDKAHAVSKATDQVFAF